MSGDPDRLLSLSSGADPLERELLDSVRHVGPPSGAKDEAWRSVAGQIAVVTAVGAAASGTAAAASKAGVGTLASWTLASKVAVVALTGGLALGGSYLALRSSGTSASEAPRPVVAPANPQASPPQAVDAHPSAAPLPEPTEAETPSRRLEPRRQDLLKAESALLMQARAQLRSGNPAAAQAALDRLQAQFPQGMLAQEREVLAIEVAFARGNVDAAKRRAKAFIKAYPKSPHSQKLSRFVE